MFLRSNGTLACWHDAGTHINLQTFDKIISYGEDVFFGPAYTRIRDSLRGDKMPFSECGKCRYLWPNIAFEESYVKNRVVHEIQVESSMACQLECPVCWVRSERSIVLPKTDAGHLILKPAVLEKVLSDLVADGVDVKSFTFVGHGDPLANAQVWEMFNLVRRCFPNTHILVTTHGNYKFRQEMLKADIDELVISLDGTDQASYEPYRINGNFSLAYQFMKDFAEGAKITPTRTKVVWKYIIFKHNDEPERLLAAQEMALRASVSRLVFVITWLGPASRMIVDETDIPLLPARGKVDISNAKIPFARLRSTLAQIIPALKNGHMKQANELFRHLLAWYLRLFPGGCRVPERYVLLLEQIVALSSFLPSPAQAWGVLVYDEIVRNNEIGLAGATPMREESAFNEDFYIAQYIDIAGAVASGRVSSGREHFFAGGFFEGRMPNAVFNPALFDAAP